MEVPETVNTSDGKCNSDDFPPEDLWPNFNAMVTKLQAKYFGAPGEKFVEQHHGFDRDFWAGASNSPTTVLYRVHMKPRTAMLDPWHCATSVAENKKVKEAEAANSAASEAAAAVESAEAKQKTETAAATGTSEAKEAKDKDEEILALIQERRKIMKDERERISEVSKKSKKCKRKKENCKARKTQKILEELKGTKNISNVKSAKKRILIPKVKNMKGETITSREGIAHVCAEFRAKIV